MDVQLALCVCGFHTHTFILSEIHMEKTTFVLNKYRPFSWLSFSKQSSVTAAYTAALVETKSCSEMA